MPAPYGIELRRRAVDAYKAGVGSFREVAELFQIGSASLKRWYWLDRDHGNVEPKDHGGGVEPRIDEKGLGILQELIEKDPDATLGELCERYCRRRRTTVSSATVGRAIRERLGLVRKKRPTAQRNATRRRSGGVGANTNVRKRRARSNT